MAINQPGLVDVHVDRPLSNLSLAFLQRTSGFVAASAFPVVSVPMKSDKFFTYDRGMFNRDEMKIRAPSTESEGVTYKISTDSYNCDVWALHVNIADEIRANADSPISLDREAIELLSIKALIRKETAWAADHFVIGKWTNDVTGVSGAPGADQFQRWDEAASDPIEQVRLGRRTVLISTGFPPNKLILGREVYDALLDHPDIVGRLDRGQGTGPAIVLRQNLAALFELDEILVMDAISNTADEGVDNVHALIGGKKALLVYSAPSPGLMVPSAGYTFVWTGLLGGGALASRITRMRVPLIKSDRIEIEMAYDQKLVAADLGYFFETAVS